MRGVAAGAYQLRAAAAVINNPPLLSCPWYARGAPTPAGKLMGQLHDRNCRRGFAPPEAFQADGLPSDRFQSEVQAATAAGRALSEEGSGRAWGLLAFAPYLVPFRERAKLFQAVVAQVRAWV